MATIFITRLSDRQRRLAGGIISSMKDVYPEKHLPVLSPARLEIPVDGYEVRDKYERLPVVYFIDRLDALNDDSAHLGQKAELRKDGMAAQNLANQVRFKYRKVGVRK